MYILNQCLDRLPHSILVHSKLQWSHKTLLKQMHIFATILMIWMLYTWMSATILIKPEGWKDLVRSALSVLHVQDRINSACVTSTSCLSKLSLKRWWQCEKITGPPVSVSPYHSFFFSFFFVLMWILLISCYFYFNSLTYRTSYYLPLPNMFLCTWRLFFHF